MNGGWLPAPQQSSYPARRRNNLTCWNSARLGFCRRGRHTSTDVDGVRRPGPHRPPGARARSSGLPAYELSYDSFRETSIRAPRANGCPENSGQGRGEVRDGATARKMLESCIRIALNDFQVIHCWQRKV